MTAEDFLDLAGKLNADGVLSGPDLEGFINVCLDALAVHVDRETIRRGMWKEYPAKDQVEVMRFKVDRMRRSLEIAPDDPQQRAAVIEECLDIINYSTFTVRLLKGEFEA